MSKIGKKGAVAFYEVFFHMRWQHHRDALIFLCTKDGFEKTVIAN